jgi:hypothetical protein
LPSPDGGGASDQAAEITSVWQLKPWWCQPWSIVLTGLAVIATSWWVLHLWWLSAGVTLVITAWWWLFLVLMPAAWKAEQATRSGSRP